MVLRRTSAAASPRGGCVDRGGTRVRDHDGACRPPTTSGGSTMPAARQARAISRPRRSTSRTSPASRSPGPTRTARPASIPIVAQGTIYGRGRNGAIVALDAKTGKEIWVHDGMQGDDGARHELLGEQGRQGPPPDLRDERLPAGDRRRDRPLDHDVRHQRRRRSARRAGPRSRRRSGASSPARRARSSRT